jgi:hypothetical protein
MKEAAKSFLEAAATTRTRIFNAIKAPESECLTIYYVLNKSEDVAKAMLKLIKDGDADKVASFLSSDARRFETLAERGQMNTLLDVLEAMSKSQQAKVLSATESVNYGAPNATVLQTIAGAKDDKVQARLAGLLRGLDSAQCTKLFSTPGAAWWMSSHERDDLMTELISALSPKQRQYIVSHSLDIGRAISATNREDFTALFKGCRFPKERAPYFGP